MKKTNFLKMAFTMVLAFLFFGASAQILIDYDNVAEVSYQTAGKTFRIYVMPDPIYSPTYIAATNANLGADARWTWTYPVGLVTGAPISGAAAAQNWVQFTAPTTGGPYTVSVVESSVLSGCVDGSAETQDVTILAAPTADIAGGGANNAWNVNTADHDYDICGDALAEDITITITETGVPAAVASYAYYVQRRVVILTAAGAEQSVVSTTAFIDHPIATKLATATANGGTEVVTTGAMPVLTYDWGSGAVLSRTMYEYTLLKPSDAAAASAQGIVSAISHKSDWLSYDQDIAADGDNGASDEDITTYAFAVPAAVIAQYVVNPTPVTGPIYTIPNNQNL